jgi:hypothetical protein
MFLLDPSEGLSRDELLEKIWQVRFTSADRAKILGIAESRGLTWLEFLRETAAEYDAEMEDPITREEWWCWHDEMERRLAMPYGPDPLLRQDGAV